MACLAARVPDPCWKQGLGLTPQDERRLSFHYFLRVICCNGYPSAKVSEQCLWGWATLFSLERYFVVFFNLLFSGILQGLQICLFIVCSAAWDENSGLSLLAPIFRFFSFLGRGCPALGSPGPQGPLGMGALQPWPIRVAL